MKGCFENFLLVDEQDVLALRRILNKNKNA